MKKKKNLKKIHSRMCEAYGFCDGCPLDGNNNGFEIWCEGLAIVHPEDYERICLEWDKEHPEEVE